MVENNEITKIGIQIRDRMCDFGVAMFVED